MEQREVQDDENIRWVCVQALSGVEGAEERLSGRDGQVPVVCTPSGGTTSVRLELPQGWLSSVSDADLLGAIAAARKT